MKYHLFLVVFYLFLSSKLIGQNEKCECDTNNSKDLYKIGQFNLIKNDLKCCLKYGTSIDKNISREILSLTAIAQDSLDIAKIYLDDLVLSNPNYIPFSNNIIFLRLFEKSKYENFKIRVSSISKRPEDIKKAPAIIDIISSDEILAAGYNDITELLSDLPGFDISKTKSVMYSNIYQLGFRADSSERTLLMIDGVEENDVFLNWSYISRQYPMSSIKAVEVVYGPASTIYGPRAFVGAINIITYQPNERKRNYFSGRFNESKKLNLRGNISSGSFNTKNIDLSLGNGNKKDTKFNYQFTGRIFESDENDMSDTSFLDYNISSLDKFQYDHLVNNIDFEGKSIDEWIIANNLQGYLNDFFVKTPNGLELTSKAKDLALQYDKAAYSGNVNGEPMDFSNSSKNYFFETKFSFNNFLFGYRIWKIIEGFGGLYNDLDTAPSENGSNWAPINKTMFFKYNNTINEKISVSVQSSFKNHRLGKETVRTLFKPFGNPKTDLSIVDLINFNNININSYNYDEYDRIESHDQKKVHGWLNRYYFYQATQGRLEARFYYDSEKFQIMSGIDYRLTSSLGDYLIFYDQNWRGSDFISNQNSSNYAEEFGNSKDIHSKGGNTHLLNDLGVYFQGSLKIGKKESYFNFGLRYDRNTQRHNIANGYTVFLPRIGFVFGNEKTVFKINASRGYQSPSLWAKYSTAGIRVPNPKLKPEGIDQVDISILGESKNKRINWNIGLFNNNVFDAIKMKPIPSTNYSQHRNVDKYNIYGAIANFKYKTEKFRFNINGNYTNPRLINDDKKIRIADISQFKINAGLTKIFKLKNISGSVNIRGNYVSSRPVGAETTVPSNPGLEKTSEIPEHFLLHSNFMLKHNKIPNVYLSFKINNILNTIYYHPGARNANSIFDLQDDTSGNYSNWYSNTISNKNCPYIIQEPQNYMLKLIFDM